MNVVPLADAADRHGRKAHGLAVLLRAGLAVPAGFVVTDPAADPALLAEHLDRLPGRAVAVRSSGLAEDSAAASFAGQLETVLGVRGRDEVLAALRHCAASARTDRARGYRAHLGLDDETSVPVLVQSLVEADRAGVLFTRDPRTGAAATVVNASWGLGESVVSGAVVPDEIVVADPADIQVTVGDKATRLDLGEQGLVRSPVPRPDRERACLAPDEVARLVGLGRRCEDLFGRPQDVEWAIRDGRIWLLQSRPITALRAPAARNGHTPAAPLVTGVPSSPGRALGPVRIIRSVDDFARMRPGDVLVCRTTDPAWTPLFRLACAVVTETGGVLSHAAIVAREFGIPAVVAAEATTALTDGAPVTVDGTAGTVTEGPTR
ncbi:PEP/pyruvate-binding domain-containing protein [Catellatospora sp. KI3]|uniref:PEP/pyruvate-binding domain-containing protein n=1 Tax=Catellatospora sp. KI3 TaxID=3041620 RepID=UPI0024821632|nr:PEP/pyruvate-binding domain-containing protein [Catellatospora sp. KI3]MDI1460625.1 PEP/pyruvate-binding domain-containing protein [Catellatospora sp. KI3]